MKIFNMFNGDKAYRQAGRKRGLTAFAFLRHPEEARTAPTKDPGILRRLRRLRMTVACLTIVLSLAGMLAFAATWTDTLTTLANYVLSDSAKITVAGGVAKLVVQKPFHQHDTKTEYDTGTYADSEFVNEAGQAASASTIKTSETGLVAYYPLNGTTGAIANSATAGLEDTKSTNEGTASNVNGTGLAFAAGKFGNGVDFDGTDDYVSIPDSAALDVSNLTISAWIKLDTTATTFQGIVGKRYDTAWAFYMDANDLKFTFLKSTGGASAHTSASNLVAGTWYHVAVTLDGTTVKIYKDGVSVYSAAVTAGAATNNNVVKIGDDDGASISPLDGTIDDVAIYNTALTANQIQAQAAAGARVHMKAQASLTKHAPKLSAGYPGLVSYWSLDHASGTVAADLAGANKGTLTNFPASPWAAAVNGNGLTFDGVNDYVSVADSASLKPKSAITISVWVNATDWAANRGMVRKANSFLFDVDALNQIRFWIYKAGGGSASKNIAAPSTGAWHHLAAVYNKIDLRVYVDGVDQGSPVASTADLATSVDILDIGKGYSSYFNGKLDEVAVFNRALSAGEIAYLAGLKGETATYTSPVMDGEIAAAAWDKLTMKFAGVKQTGANLVAISGASLAWGQAGAAADIDGDGDLDMIDGTASSTYWYANDGTGRTWAAASTIVASGPENFGVAAADLDRDGDQDVVVSIDANGALNWYANNGSGGGWTATTIKAAFGGSVAVGDIDADGDTDVVAANSTATTLSWFANDGSGGGWTETVIDSGMAGIIHLDLGDLDGDGTLDVAASSSSATPGVGFYYWKNTAGTGASWSARQLIISVTYTGGHFAIGDLDGDGDSDILGFSLNNNPPAGNLSREVSWMANNGTGGGWTETQLKSYASNQSGITIEIADLDGDGNMDVAWSSGATLSWRLNNGGASFAAEQTRTASSNSLVGLFSGDFNGDGISDLASVGTDTNGTVGLYLNTPWKANTFASGTPLFGTRRAVTVADFDNDGKLDLAEAFDYNSTTDQLYWAKGVGDGSFNAITSIQNPYEGVNSAFAYDVNQDGFMDLVTCADSTTDEVAWWQGDGGTTWTKKVVASAYGDCTRAKAADIDGDAKTDIVTRADLGGGSGELAIWDDDNADNIWTKTAIETSADLASGNRQLEIVDLNADGRLDIIADALPATFSVSTVYWWQQTATPGTFAAKASISTNYNSSSLAIAIADIDGDGLLDITDQPYGNNNDGWKRQNPAGTFEAIRLFDYDLGNSGYIAADIDGDGDIDLIGGGANPVAILENDGSPLDGGWRKQSIPLTFSQTTDPPTFAADFDNDGLLDLLGVDTSVRPLTAMQKAASWIKFQVRTDTTATPATAYIGPDGTALTYYGSGAGVKENTAGSARYAQYKATFYRNDTTLDPMIKDARLDYTALTYSTTNPTVEPATGTAFTYLTSFAETVTKPVGSEIKYLLSPDNGAYWYYHNGTAWATSDGTYAQANLASAINTNIAGFDDKAYTDLKLPENSTGTLKYRAFLNSDGTALPQLDTVAIGYETGSITMTAPNGAETWKIGKPTNITWTTTGLVPNDLTLEYTKDDLNYTSIATAQSSTSPYAWTVPNDASATVKVRARSVGVPAIRDKSNANFTIADLNIGAPNGGEFWKVGTSQNITWTKAGTVPDDLVLEYTTDGTAYTSIATALNATTATPYAWTVPAGAISPTTKVRVRSASATELADPSNAVFTVYDLKVTAPNTAVGWPAGSSQNITWTHNGIPGTTVKLQVSTDALHTTWTDIATLLNKTTATPYAWTVPNTLSTTTKIRIIDESQALVTDDSDVDFEISGSVINVSKPAAGEAVGVGTVKKVNWSITGPIPTGAKLRLHYSTDGKANTDATKTWNLIDTLVVPNTSNGGSACDTGTTGCYDWAVPSNATASATVVVRVQDDPTWDTIGGQNAVDGFSPVFKLTGTITMIQPSGGQKWAYGAAHTIQYQTIGTIANVKITAAKDGNFANAAGGNIVTISASTSNTGSYSWTPVIGDAAVSGLKIRVEDAGDADVKSDSAAISVTGVTVTAPNAAARVKAGDAYSITWTQTGIANVKIEYAENGTTYSNTVIASTPVGTNSYSWTLPLKTMTGLRVKVSDADAVPAANGTDTALANDSSDASTVVYGTITLVAPNGNEDWSASNPHDITWTVTPAGANVIPNVKIFYTTASFATETLEVDTGVTKPSNNNPGNGTGKYVWTPAFTASTVKLRIVDAGDPAVSAGAAAPAAGQNQDDSDAFFQVSGISLTAPVGAETWTVGTSQNIVFGFTGTLTNAKLEYSPNGGTTWTNINANVAVSTNPMTVAWTIPDDISTNVKVRVTQVNSDGTVPATPKQATSGVLTITGALTSFTAGGTAITTSMALAVGNAETIGWTKTGTITSQKLEYSTDGGTTWVATPIATAIAGSSQSWTIPDAIGTNVKLRLTDTTTRTNGSPAISLTSAAFSIKSRFAVTAPIVTDKWGANRTYNITGTMTGTVTALKLEYVDVATSTATTITASTAVSGASFTYSWGIPATILNAARNLGTDPIKAFKIRVTDATTGHTGNAAATLDSANFDIIYYKITWAVRDSATSGLLSSLSVAETFDGDGSATWTVSDNTLNSSGLYRYYRYGTYSTSWSKSAYANGTASSWVADSDKTVTVFLESDAEKSVQYDVVLVSTLNESIDTLELVTWLQRLGKIVTNESLLGTATIDIFDGATKIATLTKTGAQINLDTAQAVNSRALNYGFSYGPPSNLVRGKVYFIRSSIVYSGSTYTSGNNYTVPGGIKPITDLLGAVGDASSVNSLFGRLAAHTALFGAVGDASSANTIFGKIAGAKAASDTAQTSAAAAQTAAAATQSLVGAAGDAGTANSVFGKIKALDALMGATGDADTATSMFGRVAKVMAIMGDPTTPAAGTLFKDIQTPRKALYTAWQAINRDANVKAGDKVTLRFKGETGKTPTIDLYDASGAKAVDAGTMTEVGTSGVYEYAYTTSSSKKEDFTALFKESTTSAMDSFTFSTKEYHPSEGAKSAADAATSATGAKSAADSAFVFAQQAAGDTDSILSDLSKLAANVGQDTGSEAGMTGRLAQIESMMASMESQMALLGRGGSSTNLDSVHADVKALMSSVQRILNTESNPKVNLESIYKASSEAETNVKNVKNTVAEVKALAQMTQELMQREHDKPVVKTWYETGT